MVTLKITICIVCITSTTVRMEILTLFTFILNYFLETPNTVMSIQPKDSSKFVSTVVYIFKNV